MHSAGLVTLQPQKHWGKLMRFDSFITVALHLNATFTSFLPRGTENLQTLVSTHCPHDLSIKKSCCHTLINKRQVCLGFLIIMNPFRIQCNSSNHIELIRGFARMAYVVPQQFPCNSALIKHYFMQEIMSCRNIVSAK